METQKEASKHRKQRKDQEFWSFKKLQMDNHNNGNTQSSGKYHKIFSKHILLFNIYPSMNTKRQKEKTKKNNSQAFWVH